MTFYKFDFYEKMWYKFETCEPFISFTNSIIFVKLQCWCMAGCIFYVSCFCGVELSFLLRHSYFYIYWNMYKYLKYLWNMQWKQYFFNSILNKILSSSVLYGLKLYQNLFLSQRIFKSYIPTYLIIYYLTI